ncbi:hypothetical protein HOD29_02125 [archaeon]|nr:hypothetical protein [archaeon]
MKHNLKITAVILLMFIITQFIGLYVVNYYASPDHPLPFGMDVPEIEQPEDYTINFLSIIISLVIAITILFLLTRFKSKIILRIWFFVVVMLALGISFTSILNIPAHLSLIALVFALPFALGKVYKRDFITHNISELFIYPGIAAVFVPLLNIKATIILLVIISLYDAWAVWKSGIMQKMAKYQMDELKVFSGFFIPYLSKKTRQKIKKLKKSNSKKGIKVNVAILGGGDVIFPIIAAGVALKVWGIWPAILIITGALLGLGSLLLFSEKKKFYPAMPFISAGIFLGMLLGWLFLL